MGQLKVLLRHLQEKGVNLVGLVLPNNCRYIAEVQSDILKVPYICVRLSSLIEEQLVGRQRMWVQFLPETYWG